MHSVLLLQNAANRITKRGYKLLQNAATLITKCVSKLHWLLQNALVIFALVITKCRRIHEVVF